jgi:Peptidase C13 family
MPEMTLRDLPATELGRMLRTSGIRWKVILVSACYSGGFIDALRDDSTLIITAARHDRSSFGCADENDFTYFGRAYFKEALPSSRTFQEAFGKADALVAEWERKDLPKEPRSLPQLHSTPAIDAQLERWAQQTHK